MGRKAENQAAEHSVSPADCSRCNRHGEAFHCFKKKYVFDIDMAREIVADGREVFELDADDVDYSIDHCEINEGHLAHVDPQYPGIVAHLYYRDDDGTVVHAHRLIDGHHRATRCRQDGLPFGVHVLSERESVAILTRGPEGSKPPHLVADEVPSTTA
ncbi:hypothetical protein [Roseimaritima ulvae]|uniref:Uncharacterized protein n=1 Tax=Roseimaritima ulvae TaxID=980254 RepID=A0A5B9QTL4_9BACT|nr:hypothetical protein [Roseimaritima ulvae]QEG40745.1 hypothetical protein UC8_27620 [Roseimaritima ulvae]